MSNTRHIHLVKLRGVLTRPRVPRPQPDRRVRACCASRQGGAHAVGCTRCKGPVQLVVTPEMAAANRAWLDSDTVRARVAALPDGEMTVKL